MDKLEQRLNQLKNSYEEVPTASNPAKIMESIKKTENKQKKKWVTQLPYVASFIGVLIIGSLLAVQLLSSQGSNQGDGEKKPEEKPPVSSEEKVTEEEIAEKQEELQNYYEELLSTSFKDQKIEIPNPEKLSYIKETKEFVEEVGSPNYKEYKNKNDLDESFEEYKGFVKDRFEMPKTDLEQLMISSKGDFSSDLMDLMRKQEDLKGYYQTKLDNLSTSGELNKMSLDFFEQQEKLLSVSDIDNPELKAFAQSIKDNGYTFIDLEGQHVVEINFQSLVDLFGGRVSRDVKDFIELKMLRVAVDGHLQNDWDVLAQKISLLDKIRINYEGTSEVIMDNEYNHYFYLYFYGADYPPAFQDDGTIVPELRASYEKFLAEQDKETEAYKRVSEQYNTLKEGNFNKSALQ